MDDLEQTVTMAPRQLVVVSTPEAPMGRGPFPQAMRCGDLLFVSGTGPLDPERNEPDVGTFEHEVRLTLRNLAKVAEAGGCDLSDAVKLTIYLADVTNVPAFNEIYLDYFGQHRPARTLVEVGLRGIQVEIDGIFACPLRVPDAGTTALEAGEAAL